MDFLPPNLRQAHATGPSEAEAPWITGAFPPGPEEAASFLSCFRVFPHEYAFDVAH